MRNPGFYVAAAGLALALAGCSKSAADKAGDQSAAVVVGIAELTGDYKANEVRADGKYKGKRVQVAGIVGDIKKSAFNQIYVELGQGKQFDVETAQCHFPDADTARVSALDKGASVTVDCRCDGKSVLSVMLQDCKFVGAPAAPASGGAVSSKDSATTGPGAEDVCKKLVAAGVAKSCTKLDAGAGAIAEEQFEIAGMPGKNGMIVRLDSDDAHFAKYVAGTNALPPSSPLRPFFVSTKTHTVVHLSPGAPGAVTAKTKALVDSL